MNNNELYHHGILGQKWGVRRYQNKDGSLTPAGRKRANKLKNEYTELTGKKLVRSSNKTKSIKDMSDSELRDKTNRLNLENNYRRALSEANSKEVSKGKKIVNTIVKSVIVAGSVEAGKNFISKNMTNIMSTALKKH